MKKVIAVLAFLTVSVYFGLSAFSQPRPGSQQYIGKNSQIYEDVSGKLMFVDGSSPGPVSLEQSNVSGYTLSTTTVSSGVGYSYEYMYLLGSTSAKIGSALVSVASTGLPTAVAVSGATNDLTTLVGISLVVASTGTSIPVATNGFVLALTTGTVNTGAVLVSTAGAAGYLSTNSNSVWGADFGLALSTGTSTGGLTLIKIRK